MSDLPPLGSYVIRPDRPDRVYKVRGHQPYGVGDHGPAAWIEPMFETWCKDIVPVSIAQLMPVPPEPVPAPCTA